MHEKHTAAFHELCALGTDVRPVRAPGTFGVATFDTGRVHGPFLPPCERCGAVVAYGGHHADCGWDEAPDTRDVRPDGPAFA